MGAGSEEEEEIVITEGVGEGADGAGEAAAGAGAEEETNAYFFWSSRTCFSFSSYIVRTWAAHENKGNAAMTERKNWTSQHMMYLQPWHLTL